MRFLVGSDGSVLEPNIACKARESEFEPPRGEEKRISFRPTLSNTAK